VDILVQNLGRGRSDNVEGPANDRLQLRKTPALPERPAILHRAKQSIVEALHGVAAARRGVGRMRDHGKARLRQMGDRAPTSAG